MSLKIALKPHEKVIIGGAVIKNGSTGSHLLVENNVPVLRQTDIITEHEAVTPCRRIYVAIQLMYVDTENRAETHTLYRELVKDLLEAAPSMNDLISQISQAIVAGSYYQALKLTKKLITYEEELLNNGSQLG